ncbi:MAG: dihydroorotate dehydrogenase [Clostridiales bacterium]|nr:dihydroorotate dehydrogenase [Clostridiales bacterium]
MADMKINLCGVELNNPIIMASGTFGFGREMAAYNDLSRLGGISSKGITRNPRPGNPTPRIAETPSGCINSVGLENPGVEKFIERELPFMKSLDTGVIVNVSGSSVEEYCETVELVCAAGADMIELNISCPNIKGGGMAFGTSAEPAAGVVKEVRKVCTLPLMVKLSPNVADIAAIAKAVEGEGADAVSLINTLSAMAIDARTRRPILKQIMGGLSGPAVKPVALRMVYQVSQAVKIPVVGLGGVTTGIDAAEFMICGASAVMVGTANLMDPYSCVRIVDELNDYLDEMGIGSAAELVGTLMV